MEKDRKIQIKSLKNNAASFPEGPGVYLFKNAYGVVLYVGKAVSLRKRVASYFNGKGQQSPKVRSMMTQVVDAEFVLTVGENQALLLESNLIKKNRPRYNVLLRDDKSYPYLKLTVQEDFPRILVSRKPLEDGSRYYGPYPNLKIRETLKVIYRFFNLRDCDIEIDGRAERACMNYQIKQCPGPCIGAIQKGEYRKLVKKVQWFLEGRHEELVDFVQTEMNMASNRREYEEAAKYRDLLTTLRQMESGYTVISREKQDVDVIALAQGMGKVFTSLLRVRQGKVIDHVKFVLENELERPLDEVLQVFIRQYYVPGIFIPDEILVSVELNDSPQLENYLSSEKGSDTHLMLTKDGWRRNLMDISEKNVLESLKGDIQRIEVLKELQKVLGLKTIPRNIACFDISTLQGSFTVGSAAFFRDGVPEKNRYRKFKIRELEGQDDYKAHQEMLRRYLHLLEREGNPLPDLFLIDGGKGQLRAAEAVLQERLSGNFDLASLAKREEEVFVPKKSSPVDFRGHLKARYLLQRIRDESHRFAVGYHRILRDQQTITSVLKNIKGVGPIRLRALFDRFESIKEMKNASLKELNKVPGISSDLAGKLYKAFHM